MRLVAASGPVGWRPCASRSKVANRGARKEGTQMAEMDEDWAARLVDDQLRFVRGEGPEPDLSGLSDSDRSEMIEVLNLVDALS